MTNIPKVRSSVAIAFPIPDPPPVTRATLPLNRPLRKTDIVLEKKVFSCVCGCGIICQRNIEVLAKNDIAT